MSSFGDLGPCLIDKVNGICGKIGRVDYVFDTYVEGSVKDTEHVHRLDEHPT